MALTQEQQAIFDAVIASIRTNSKTVEQLTPQTSLAATDWFELNGGRKVSYAVLSDMIMTLISENQEFIGTLGGKFELQSVSIASNVTSASLTIKAQGKTITCSIPMADDMKAGFVTADQVIKLEAADSRKGVLPIDVVDELRTGTTYYISPTDAANTDSLLQYLSVEKNKVTASVKTDLGGLQLWVSVSGSTAAYYADDWGDMPELCVSALGRYQSEEAVMIDFYNSKAYIWASDYASLNRLADETDISDIVDAKGQPNGFASLNATGVVPAIQLPEESRPFVMYSSDISASGVTIASTQPTGNYNVVWVANSDGSGRFAAQDNPSVAGSALHGTWANYKQYCTSAGLPLGGKIYRRTSDNMLLAKATDATNKLVIVGNAFNLSDYKGKPNGVASLDSDKLIPPSQIPPSVRSVADYKEDVDASGVTVASTTTTSSSYEVLWVKNTDGTGRFAARALPSVVGDSLHAKWNGWQGWCDTNGKPLLNHIYRRTTDNALLVADTTRTKLEVASAGQQQGDSDGGKLALFVDMWNNAWGDYGGYYPDTAPDPAKPFKGNDLWMTYEEALTVDRESSGSNYLRDYSHAQCTARTFYPISTHGGSYAQESKYAFVGCVNLEVIRFKGTIYTGLGQDCFYKCSKLKKIVGGGGLRPMHKDVFNLEAIEDFNAVISSDLNLSKASKVSLATLQYLVQHAANGNTAITVTVHANVYAKLTGNITNAAAGALTSGELAQWQAVVTAAAAKNISFASA